MCVYVCVSTFTGWGWCYTVFFLREVWGVRQSLVPALFESITSLFSVNSNPTASSYKSQKKVACIDRGESRFGILTQNCVLSSPGPLLKMERLVSMVITHLHATDRDKRRAIKRVRQRLSWHTHTHAHFFGISHTNLNHKRLCTLWNAHTFVPVRRCIGPAPRVSWCQFGRWMDTAYPPLNTFVLGR